MDFRYGTVNNDDSTMMEAFRLKNVIPVTFSPIVYKNDGDYWVFVSLETTTTKRSWWPFGSKYNVKTELKVYPLRELCKSFVRED